MLCRLGKDQRRGSRQVGRIPPGELRRGHRISIRDTYLGCFEVDEDVVVIVDGVCVCMRIAATALEIFTTDETSINIKIQGRD
jgi:hypothetical protein